MPASLPNAPWTAQLVACASLLASGGLAQAPKPTVEQLRSQFAASDDPLERAKIQLRLAYRTQLTAEMRLVAAERALQILEPDGDPALRSFAWSAVSWTHNRLGHADRARTACERAVELARTSKDRSRLHTAISTRGALAYEKGDLPAALADFAESLRLAEDLENQDHVASACNNLGLMARLMGASQQAAEYYERALAAAVRAGNRYLQASTANNLALMTLQLGLPAEALERYQQTLDLATQEGIAHLQFVGRRGIASARLALGEAETAVAELRTLVRDHASQAEPKQLAGAFKILARAELAVDHPAAAVSASRRAAALYADAGAKTRRQEALNQLARALAATGDFAAALDVIDDVLAKSTDDKPLHHTAMRTKAAILAETGEHADAYALSREADHLRQQLSEERAREQLAVLRASSESARRDHELAALRARQASVEAGARLDRWIMVGTSSLTVVVLAGGFVLYRSRARRRSAEQETASARERLAHDAALNAELERQVALRSEELRREIRERRTLEERFEYNHKLEAIGKLTGGIAHDFNNLMTVVLASMDLLRLESGDVLRSDQIDLIDDAAKAAQSGAGITQRLLAFARQQTLQPAAVRVTEYLAGVEGLLRRAVGDGIVLQIECESPDLSIFVDTDQLTTALINLAANARDAMNERGTLRIRGTRLLVGADEFPGARSSHYAAIVVTDDGKGMTREELARAFEPFFSTKEFSAGSGLGLSMVFGFARQSGGDIQLESTPGKGTIATLLLPESGPQPAAEVTRGADDESFVGMTALVVEDRRELQEVEQRLLVEMGFTVDVAENAEEARRLLTDAPPPDFVLSDIVMPGAMDGIELAQWIATEHPTVRVLLTSGYADLRRAAASGFQVLPKPFSHDALRHALRTVLPARAASDTYHP